MEAWCRLAKGGTEPGIRRPDLDINTNSLIIETFRELKLKSLSGVETPTREPLFQSGHAHLIQQFDYHCRKRRYIQRFTTLYFLPRQ